MSLNRRRFQQTLLHGAWLGAWPALGSATTQTGPQSLPANFLVGVCDHMAQGRSQAAQAIDTMTVLGANSFRDDAFWSRIERQRGQFAWPTEFAELERGVNLARQRGIEPLLILAYGNSPLHHTGQYPVDDAAQAAFVRYAEWMARYFKGRVRHFEVWNEWNTRGDPRDYARLIAKVYPALKKIDPALVVVGGAVEGAGRPDFIQALAQQGALAHMDYLSVHPYVFWRGHVGTPQALHRWLENLQRMLMPFRNGQAMPLLLTEIGWPDSAELAVPPARVAEYATQTVLMLRSLPYVHGVWWYNLTNNGRNRNEREHNWGLIREDGVRKPAFTAFQTAARIARQARAVQRLPSDPSIWALRFELAGNAEDVLAVWSGADPGKEDQGPPPAFEARLSARNTSTRLFATTRAAPESWPVGLAPTLLQLPRGERVELQFNGLER